MATVARVRSIWSGPAITGGGVTDHYFFGSAGDEQGMVDAVHDFWDDMKTGILSPNAVNVSPDVFNINDSDGALVSIVSVGTPPATVTGAGTGDPLPPATQGLLQWRTAGIVNNRVVRGRTFIPAQGEGGSASGAPDSGLIALYQTAANNLIALVTPQLQVWHRPLNGTGGSSHAVTSASVWQKWAVLRSRRD